MTPAQPSKRGWRPASARSRGDALPHRRTHCHHDAGSVPATTSPDRSLRRLADLAAVWSVVVLVVGSAWALGAPGCFFGAEDPRSHEVGSVFANWSARTCGAATGAVGAFGLVVAASTRTAARTRLTRWIWLVAGSVNALVYLLAVPDIRMIQNFAYLFFGYTGLWDWPLLAMVLSVGAGVVWVRLVRAIWAPARVPRSGPPRWGTPITYAAAALALPYPAVRIGWALDLPVGVTATYLADQDLVQRVGEAVLGGLAVGGAVLTIGLVRPWGEVFPRMLPVVGGRPVPVWCAVVPGLLAAALITQMGVRILVWTANGPTGIGRDDWGMSAPGLFFLPWGLALAAAVHAYAVRRRHAPEPGPGEAQ